MSHQGPRLDGLNLIEEAQIEGAIREVRRIADTNPSAPESWEQRLHIARTAIATLDATGFVQMPNRNTDRTFVIATLQSLAYHDAEGVGVTDIAEWCMNQWLLLLQRNTEDLSALRGLGQAWLARSQSVLARIHRTEGSSSSGSSGRPQSLSERLSYSTAEESRDAERATAEADARAHTADYVEARGMLIPAVDYFSRAVNVAERDGEPTGELLSEESRTGGTLANIPEVLEARLEQAAMLKKVVDAIKDLVQDCNFDCNDSGIALQAMDNSHVALVSMMLKAEMFSPYRCDRNIALGINLNSLTKVIRAAQNEDILTIKAEDSPDVVNLVFESSDTDRISEYDIKLMDIDQEHLGIPDTEYSATIEMPSAEFQRICRDLIAMSESVSIEASKDGVRFSCQGDIGSGSVTIRQNSSVDKPDQEVKIALSEPVSLTFSLKYLVNFCKASSLSTKVKLCLSQEVPLLVEYNLSGSSYLRFYLAPKIGDDE
ncbi:hypothetical protein AYO21_04457 [Fonsecaea monophora]|uniref:DNA sliding clamp PCNA n=1 Tax=Fonsecaea monophora TaxID=254056 RepID=A0A177FAN3_9EURO|nr:hypothetical protein AYO21_04457 [Fonsecaea monophora]OAG41294.1 hypothetical protein AYO21_04457 [Fonsecaea monophora]